MMRCDLKVLILKSSENFDFARKRKKLCGEAKLMKDSTGIFPAKEIKEYYAANKAKFTKPATVTISEIFLSFAGRDKEEVKKEGCSDCCQSEKW